METNLDYDWLVFSLARSVRSLVGSDNGILNLHNKCIYYDDRRVIIATVRSRASSSAHCAYTHTPHSAFCRRRKQFQLYCKCVAKLLVVVVVEKKSK